MGDLSKENKKEELKAAIRVLALELELHEGRRFDISKGAAEVAKVLKFSSQSDIASVIEHLYGVIQMLTPAQIQFFQQKGVVLDLMALSKKLEHSKHQERQTVVYRGNEQQKQSEGSSNIEDESPENQGKKKIVYRGQVKWV